MDSDSSPSGGPEPETPPAGGQASETSAARRSRHRRRRKVPPRAVKRNYLLHLLFYDRAFRWAAVVGLIFFGAMAVVWPKIWVTSPEGVYPVIKVRGLDLLQARSLKRTALAAEAAGRTEAAVQAWLSALANNQADVSLNRGLLGTLAAQPEADLTWLKLVGPTANWLLRLTATNQADLELCARVNATYGQWEWVLQHLGSTNSPRTEVTTPLLLAALFHAGNLQRFAVEYREHGARHASNPEVALYHAAWQAGWGEGGEAGRGRELLEAVAQEPDRRVRALRLLLRVDFQRVDLARFEAHLGQLQALLAVRLRDHVRHWQLLMLVGQRERAIQLARQLAEPATTVEEADLLVTTLGALKLGSQVVEFAERQMPQFQTSPGLWLKTAQALAGAAEWDALRKFASDMRQQDRLSEFLAGMSWFYDGVAEHGRGLTPRAQESFKRVLDNPPPDPATAFQAAVTMNRLGYPEPATRLLQQLEAKVGKSPGFWMQLQMAAHDARQVDVLIEASRRLYELTPKNPVAANNYAASLLLLPDRSAEAVQATFEVLNRQPQSVPARINRALALVQAGRAEDAGQMLASLTGATLNPQETAMLHFTRFGHLRLLGRTNDALAAAALIEQRLLFPTQVEWLNEAVAGLQPK